MKQLVFFEFFENVGIPLNGIRVPKRWIAKMLIAFDRGREGVDHNGGVIRNPGLVAVVVAFTRMDLSIPICLTLTLTFY